MDLSFFKAKVDHFEEIHALGEENMVNGAPNLRQVGGLRQLLDLTACLRYLGFQFLDVLSLLKVVLSKF